MKNFVIIIIIVLAVGSIGFFVFSLRPASKSESLKKGESVNNENAEVPIANTNSSARYLLYSKSSFEQAAGARRVLFFYANWCPICKPADISFQENESKIPEDVALIRVNYNDTETDQDEKDLAQKYGIVYQHTFVQIDSSGNEIAKWNGGQIEELLANIK